MFSILKKVLQAAGLFTLGVVGLCTGFIGAGILFVIMIGAIVWIMIRDPTM